VLSQRADLARHVERQMRAQERQIVVARFVVVALTALPLLVLGDIVPRAVALAVILAVVAAYNVVIAMLVSRFPAQEVGVVATALDMIAVSLAVYVSPTLVDVYLFYAFVILGVAMRFGLWASVWSSVVIVFLYASVLVLASGSIPAALEVVPLRAVYLLGIGVAGGLLARVVVERAQENARLQQQLEREAAERDRAREKELLSQLSSDLGTSFDQDATTEAVSRAASLLLGNLTALLLVDEAEGVLQVSRVVGADDALADRMRSHLAERPIRVGKGIIGSVAATATSVLSDPNPAAEAGDPDGVTALGIGSLLAVPILSRGAVHGVLVNAAVSGELGLQQLRVAEAIAERAGRAIENASLWRALQHQVNRMEALQQVVAEITSNLAATEITEHLSRSLAQIFGADRSAIFLREESGRIVCAAAHNLSAAFTAAVASDVLGAPGGLGATLREPLLVLDVRSDARAVALREHARAEGFASMLILPLVYGMEAIGAITLYHDRQRNWDVAELSLARTFADQAAIALSNATLFTREKRAQRIKDDFLSIVSHELRTPLTSIQGYSQLLEARLAVAAANGKEMAHLRVIRSQVQRMRRLVDDILDVSRIDRRGAVSIEPQRLDLAEELRELVGRLARDQPDRRVFLDIPESMPVEADRDRIAQVLTNLTDNAMKYSPDGGPVSISAVLDADEVLVRVTDEGIGIPAEHIDHVFERFYQAGGERDRRRFGGLGLGLYISQAIIDAHGGRIWAEPNTAAGRGAVFAFRLPLRATVHAVAPPAGEGEPPPFVAQRRWARKT
jgi:signal transduction histidine kinase